MPNDAPTGLWYLWSRKICFSWGQIYHFTRYRNSSISPNHLIIRTPIIICDNNFWAIQWAIICENAIDRTTAIISSCTSLSHGNKRRFTIDKCWGPCPGGCTPISDLYGYVRPQTLHYLPLPVPKPPTIYPDPFAEPPSFYPCPFEVHTKSTGTRSFTVNCEIIYL